ncbi:hypothetical protein HDE_02965 [Halotydeus destructor]|nr:hypothetical protein HDE_02965 [Halotydeus destructor]
MIANTVEKYSYAPEAITRLKVIDSKLSTLDALPDLLEYFSTSNFFYEHRAKCCIIKRIDIEKPDEMVLSTIASYKGYHCQGQACSLILEIATKLPKSYISKFYQIVLKSLRKPDAHFPESCDIHCSCHHAKLFRYFIEQNVFTSDNIDCFGNYDLRDSRRCVSYERILVFNGIFNPASELREKAAFRTLRNQISVCGIDRYKELLDLNERFDLRHFSRSCENASDIDMDGLRSTVLYILHCLNYSECPSLKFRAFSEVRKLTTSLLGNEEDESEFDWLIDLFSTDDEDLVIAVYTVLDLFSTDIHKCKKLFRSFVDVAKVELIFEYLCSEETSNVTTKLLCNYVRMVMTEDDATVKATLRELFVKCFRLSSQHLFPHDITQLLTYLFMYNLL